MVFTPNQPDPELRCQKCGGRAFRASGATQMLKTDGADRLHADISCAECGATRWSRSEHALDLARAVRKDREQPIPVDVEPAEGRED